MKMKRVAVGAGALALSAAAIGAPGAGASIVIDGVPVPWVSSGNRPVYEASASGSASGFLVLHMTVVGRRSSWSGMRDETSATFKTSDFGHYRKVEQCGVSGTYTRASRFAIDGYVNGGSSVSGNGFGASYSGPISFDTVYDSAGTDITCTADSYYHTWVQ